jgi:orotate phosphoribosyltransferase
LRSASASASAAAWRAASAAAARSAAVSARPTSPVVAIAGLDDLLAFAGESAELVAQRERLLDYRARHGCTA